MKPLCLFFLLGVTLALAPAADPPQPGDAGKSRTEQWPASGMPAVRSRAPWEGNHPDAAPAAVDLAPLLKIEDKEVNGVLLTITPRLAVGVQYRLNIEWAIKYSGPRWPLVIEAPDLERPAGATSLHLFAIGKSGKAYECVVESPLPPAVASYPIVSKKDWYMVIEEPSGRGGQSGPNFELVPEDLRRYFRRHLPAEFDPAKPPKLYVRLVHRPADRAEHLKLDAWTGILFTGLKPVELPEW